MDAMEQRLAKSAAGEHRLDPDQQRAYFNTFKERVVLTVSVANAKTSAVKTHFEAVLGDLADRYQPLTLKISPCLPTDLQLFYLKLAKGLGITTCIVDEDHAHSAFGLVLHTDHAVNLPETSFAHCYPQYFTQEEPVNQQDKKSFWSKLFG
ncbi:YueI family protein [Streptococcus sp. DD12]|uniref:YueI family protein n=1 Tax=Streptococcus sp. DD12 TaxID=1777880 RepID=UPI000798AF31|nr:YueI family protein [Streptococcus sp. DD12]KXT76801.1 hypothetical protein STRDD12_00206 [Streptococcus sp. DD12]